MRFSVIIPVYNVESFLERCIESVLSQDYEDYEIIAVDDGSKDSSLEILKSYERKTNKIHIISQENKGLGGARNTGIVCAKGDYLVFLDSDDYIKTDMLSSLNSVLIKENFDILAFDCVRVTNEGRVLNDNLTHAGVLRYLTPKEFLLLEPTSCTKVYRRTLYTDNDIYFPEKLWYEDLATVFRLVPHIKKVGYLNEAFYFYVQQPQSITHSVNTERMMEITTAFDYIVDYFQTMGEFENYYNELEWNCVLHVLYYSAFRLLMCGYNKKKMKQLFLYSKRMFPDIENNNYVKQKMFEKDMMTLIIRRKYFTFYMKTGFRNACVSTLKNIKKMFCGE